MRRSSTSDNSLTLVWGSRFVRYLLLLLSLLAPAALAETVEVWLDKMNDAVHGLNYTGTYVYINKDRIDTMQIVHRVDAKGERERLLSLNGEAREILRDSEKVTCILPADKSVVVGQHKKGTRLPALVPADVLEFSKLYTIELIGRDRIAGYPAVILSIVPNDKMRYGYRIWLEEDTGMVLRSDIMDSDARVIEQMMFTEISMQTPISNDMLEPTVAHEEFQVITDQVVTTLEQRSSQAVKLSFVNIPKGFRIADHSVKNMPMKKHPVQHYVLSDGLATVSVYVEKSTTVEQALDGESKMGSINAYGRQLSDYQITVMGEVPGDTVKQIAEAVSIK
jgi:sigma-E factor negative regulatory protein RseB